MILSIIINTVIFIATAIILLHNFWKDGKWNTRRVEVYHKGAVDKLTII